MRMRHLAPLLQQMLAPSIAAEPAACPAAAAWLPLQTASGEGEGEGEGEVPMAVSLRPAAFGSCDMPTPRMGLQAQASGRMGQLLASMSLDR